MFLFKKITFIIFFILTLSKNVYSNDKIFYLDMESVVKNSNIGKSLLLNINNRNAKNVEILKNKEQKLKKIEEDIKKKQNIISKEELDKEIKNLRNQINDLRVEKNNMVKDISNFKKEELKKLYKKINPIIQSYMEENNISIILDMKNIVIGKISSNITKEIIDKINTELN